MESLGEVTAKRVNLGFRLFRFRVKSVGKSAGQARQIFRNRSKCLLDPTDEGIVVLTFLFFLITFSFGIIDAIKSFHRADD